MKAGKEHVQGVEITDNRTRLNLMGALNLQRIEETIMREYPGINAENMAYFLGAVRETYPISQKIHIILGRTGYHRTDLVKDIAGILNIELY
ncbi:transposase [Xenorhabdus cabanillasii]|uniref:Transposase n=1 Tax=Xenorhabdus cabanillasii JM26 TaxID=1427517 RepID=W1J184_9GAMM